MSSNVREDNERSEAKDGISMRKIDASTLSSFSELLINLSAAWFFAAIVTPFSQQNDIQTHIIILTGNFILGIVCLELGIRLRRLKKRYGN